MKIRTGFVSNSSSSSFVIHKSSLTAEQLDKILNHSKEAFKILGYETCDDQWNISQTDSHVRGWTDMDNFDMAWFLDEIGVRSDAIEWGDGWDLWIPESGEDSSEN